MYTALHDCSAVHPVRRASAGAAAPAGANEPGRDHVRVGSAARRGGPADGRAPRDRVQGRAERAAGGTRLRPRRLGSREGARGDRRARLGRCAGRRRGTDAARVQGARCHALLRGLPRRGRRRDRTGERGVGRRRGRLAGRAATARVSARRPADTPNAVQLLLDEMHSATISEALRERGHDVIAIVELPELRALTDEEVFAWAAEQDRRTVTENAKDFRRILLRAEEAGQPTAGLLLTSSRT